MPKLPKNPKSSLLICLDSLHLRGDDASGRFLPDQVHVLKKFQKICPGEAAFGH